MSLKAIISKKLENTLDKTRITEYYSKHLIVCGYHIIAFYTFFSGPLLNRNTILPSR
jgi:hypothetical protein